MIAYIYLIHWIYILNILSVYSFVIRRELNGFFDLIIREHEEEQIKH